MNIYKVEEAAEITHVQGRAAVRGRASHLDHLWKQPLWQKSSLRSVETQVNEQTLPSAGFTCTSNMQEYNMQHTAHHKESQTPSLHTDDEDKYNKEFK